MMLGKQLFRKKVKYSFKNTISRSSTMLYGLANMTKITITYTTFSNKIKDIFDLNGKYIVPQANLIDSQKSFLDKWISK